MTINGLGSRNVTWDKFFFAIVGELLLFVGYIWVDRISTENRQTKTEERINAIYTQLPRLREEQTEQDKRLMELEHQVIKLDAARSIEKR